MRTLRSRATLRQLSSPVPERVMPFTRSGRTSSSAQDWLKPEIAKKVHGNGLKARDGAPFGTWQDRFIDWFRDLGFLGKPGVETKAAQEIAAHLAAPTSTK